MQRKKINILYVLVFTLVMLPFVSPSAWAQDKVFTVVIDAGHGGNDPGAIGRKGREKNINLNVALKLGSLIQQNCADTRVVYTRKKDVFVPLHRRAEIANEAKADLFISIHTNSLASRNSRVSGTETYTLGLHRTDENLEVAKKENAVILIEDDYKQRYAGFNPNSSESYIIFEFLQDKNMAQSVNFARLVQGQFRANHRIDKGVHQAGFLVLRETSMPSVLVELGYITNQQEEAFLLSENGSSVLAQGIYRAFLTYKQSKGRVMALPDNGGRDAVKTENAVNSEMEYSESDIVSSEKTSSGKAPAKSEKTSVKTSSSKSLSQPVFKIQILTSGKVLPKNSRLLKGLSPVSYYKEGGIIKYTYGEDTDYNKILLLKRMRVDAKFKDAFIIAFRSGEKMNVNQAIKEFKKNRK